MFGYVKPLKDELKIREFDIFRSYYCGLCTHIKRDFGEVPRLTLNYDMTALALLLDGLSPKSTYAKKQFCAAHPLKKMPMVIQNDALTYAAALNVSLSYYKVLDDVQDEGKLVYKTLAQGLGVYHKKIKPSFRPVDKKINTQLNALYTLEKNKDFCSIDEISHPFGQLVGELLKYYPYPILADSPKLRQSLFDFGYTLGKWIYIIDALDDLEKDMAEGSFNPIYELYKHTGTTAQEILLNAQDAIRFTLLNCGYTCKQQLNRLPLVRNKAILQNIVILGMMEQYTKVTKSCPCKKER